MSHPGWHADYLATVLAEGSVHPGEVAVLVSGCADYAVFAHVNAVIGDRARVTALDWCPTPLVSTEWYARQVGRAVPRLVVADAVTFVERGSFDLVVSDSFLPRFSDEQVRLLLASWRACLRPGGVAITTARIHEQMTPGEQRPVQVKAWREVAERHRQWWPSVSRLPADEMVERVTRFAQLQERNAVYDIDDLHRLFRAAGFTNIEVDVASINEKRFARLVAS